MSDNQNYFYAPNDEENQQQPPHPYQSGQQGGQSQHQPGPQEPWAGSSNAFGVSSFQYDSNRQAGQTGYGPYSHYIQVSGTDAGQNTTGEPPSRQRETNSQPPQPGHFYGPQDSSSSSRVRPPMTIAIPAYQSGGHNQSRQYESQSSPLPTYFQPTTPASYDPINLSSPYRSQTRQVSGNSGTSNSPSVSDYFQPYETSSGPIATPFGQPSVLHPPPLPRSGSSWSSTGPYPHTRGRVKRGGSSNRGKGMDGPSGEKSGTAKTNRQQFTACGACRHRRVKCDLKDRQEEAERLAAEDLAKASSSTNAKSIAQRKQLVSCSNCIERGTNCVDEFAPVKAAKQLRRGKRISEIEKLYGKQTIEPLIHPTDGTASVSSRSSSKGKLPMDTEFVIPALSEGFIRSEFFKRLSIIRPAIDPSEVEIQSEQTPEKQLLLHALYAWAVATGVDENGEISVPGKSATYRDLSPQLLELERAQEREDRSILLTKVIHTICAEIDQCAAMRRPTWDGLRAMLLVLPLTTGILPPLERDAIYNAVLSQTVAFCTNDHIGYDGEKTNANPSEATPTSRIMVYSYVFLHESIVTGLKGGKMYLDEADMTAIAEENRALIRTSASHRRLSKFCTPPLNYGTVCRKINKALTGVAARNSPIKSDMIREVWEGLESCWQGYENWSTSDPLPVFEDKDITDRYSAIGRLSTFDSHSLVYRVLEDRLTRLSLPAAGIDNDGVAGEVLEVRKLLDIAKVTCENQARSALRLIKDSIGTDLFFWDLGLLSDMVLTVAQWLIRLGRPEEDIAVCVQALDEIRFSQSRSTDHISEIRRLWNTSRPGSSNTTSATGSQQGWDAQFPQSSNVLRNEPGEWATQYSSSTSYTTIAPESENTTFQGQEYLVDDNNTYDLFQ